MSSSYGLERGYLASVRLDLQHYVWTNTHGYHLHPAIGHATDSIKILDAGTGTGLWAIDIARARPASKVYASDIDLSQCPVQEWLPGNMTTFQFDLMDGEVPSEYVGFFDIIHLRHFQVVASDPKVPLSRLMKMLKPGGYLQWSEYDLITRRFLTARPDAGYEKCLQMLQFIKDLGVSHIKSENGWGTSLQKTLIDSGLELIAVDRRFPPPHLRNAWENIQIMNIRELGHKMPEERKAEWAEKLEVAFKELQEKGRGFVHSPDMITYVVMKPVADAGASGSRL